MATLLTRAARQTLTIGDGALAFRVATTLDRDVATETAKDWMASILQGGELASEFGLEAQSLTDIITRVATGERDIHAYSTALFAVALALRLQPEISGLMVPVTGAEPRALEASRADIGFLFQQADFQSRFLQLAMSDVLELETLGKPSAPASGSSAGAAQKSAPDVST